LLNKIINKNNNKMAKYHRATRTDSDDDKNKSKDRIECTQKQRKWQTNRIHKLPVQQIFKRIKHHYTNYIYWGYRYLQNVEGKGTIIKQIYQNVEIPSSSNVLATNILHNTQKW
jgi:hypothetical protein